MGIFEILSALGKTPQNEGQNPNAPVGAQGSVLNTLTGGAPRQGSVFAGLQGLFGPGGQPPQAGASPTPPAAAPTPPAAAPTPPAGAAPAAATGAAKPPTPVAPVQPNFAALAEKYGLPSDGYLAQRLFG